MIKKFFTLLCLCTLCIGSAWGETKTLTETFESANTSTTYNSTQTIDVEKSSCGISWSVYYGSPSTTSAITGSKSCLIRYYTDAAKLGYAQTTTGIKGLTKISFNAKVTNTGNKMGVWYSTDQSNWNQLVSDVVLTTNSQNKSYDIPNPDATKTYYIKIGLTTGSTTNKKDLIIDDVVFTYEEGTGPSLSVSPATIDFGEVYQNATVDAKEVTVSFANLTTNDVAAAISGTAFGINKTSSFTSGDKITITPTTATLGKYSETLTVFATGVDDQKVTVTMNVVEAPSWIYKHVTDASTLKAGDIIVIGATKDNKSYVAGALEGDFLSSKEATIKNSILSASEAVEFTLGGEAGSWTLTSSEGTLGATAVKKLTYDGTKDKFVGTWTISIDEDNNATISSTGEGYGRFLYNAGNPRFLTYTSETNVSMLLPQIYRKEVSAKITSTGYATFSSDYALNLSNLPEGLTAYKATTAGNGKVHMVAVEEAVAGNTGLFLEGEAGTTYTIPVAASGTALVGNLLKATTGEALAEGDYVYVIASGAFQPLANNTVVSKGKAYIPASAITTSGKLEISFGEPTGITSYENENFKAMTVYNLQGVRVNNSYKGIVIMNGKKYINK